MNTARFYILLQRFKKDTLNQQEWEELRLMVKNGHFEMQLEDDFLIALEGKGVAEKWTPETGQMIWNEIEKHITPYKRTFSYRPWIAAAAILFITITAGLYFFKMPDQPARKTTVVKNDIAPGGNKAVLTLADGRKIILNDSGNGELAKQSGISITKTADGQLMYKTCAAAHHSDRIEFNTIATPRGGQYQVILPDGTHVWLNASSSLKYPALFKGAVRLVELTGEAYFEVVKNRKMPFKVQTATQEIEVLGTHFNINSYVDEPACRTTLLEGSVKVRLRENQQEVKFLAPGQFAESNKRSGTILVKAANIEEAIAWKNGYFIFNDEKLESIMRKVARWYDVDIRYEGKLEDLSFLGIVERSKKISLLLEVLESTGNIHFKIEGREVVVMP